MGRGTLGFTAVSVAAFSVWAFGGRWFSGRGGEVVMYAAITLVFLGLSGLLLYPLAGSVARFYKAFVPAFVAYAVVWSAIWFATRSRLGEWLASAAGSVVFAALAGWALGGLRSFLKAVLVLFVAHSAGYFLGGEVYYSLKDPATVGSLGLASKTAGLLGRLGWGLLYGLGFGAGLGCAFFSFRSAGNVAEGTHS